jgi:hypothetical protein
MMHVYSPVVSFGTCTESLARNHHHDLDTSSTGKPVGYKGALLTQHLNTHKQQLHALRNAEDVFVIT